MSIQVFDGNTDRNTAVSSLFPKPFQATHIRIRPTAWQSHISMRFEILGCEGTLFKKEKEKKKKEKKKKKKKPEIIFRIIF